jgi:hypothetical protein
LNSADGAIVKKSISVNMGGARDAYYTLHFDTATTRVFGMRAYNPTRPGIIFTPLAVGGYKMATVVANHGGCGPIMQSIGSPRFVIVDLGINDNSGGVGNSASVVRADAIALASFLRTVVYNNPNLRIVFLTHTYFTNTINQSKQSEGDQYAGAVEDAFTADSMVSIWNVRRVLREQGWNESNFADATVWLNDGTHYTAIGGMMKAAAIAALFGQATRPPKSRVFASRAIAAGVFA